MMSSSPWVVIVVGAVVGVFVGLLGTSGAIMIPVMIYVFGLTQLKAQGTSLFIALIPIWAFPLVPSKPTNTPTTAPTTTTTPGDEDIIA